MPTILDTTNDAVLLDGLRNDDGQAWNDFVEQYSPLVFSWCRQYSLQENDASDVTQNVLVKVVCAMRAGRYNESKGNFRAWLKTVTRNAICDLMRGWDEAGGGGDTEMLANLATAPETAGMDAELEREHEKELLRQAERRVRQRVQPHTWEAFRLSAVELVSAKETAQRLGMRVGEVYVAKSRVIKLLNQEVTRMQSTD